MKMSSAFIDSVFYDVLGYLKNGSIFEIDIHRVKWEN